MSSRSSAKSIVGKQSVTSFSSRYKQWKETSSNFLDSTLRNNSHCRSQVRSAVSESFTSISSLIQAPTCCIENCCQYNSVPNGNSSEEPNVNGVKDTIHVSEHGKMFFSKLFINCEDFVKKYST